MTGEKQDKDADKEDLIRTQLSSSQTDLSAHVSAGETTQHPLSLSSPFRLSLNSPLTLSLNSPLTLSLSKGRSH